MISRKTAVLLPRTVVIGLLFLGNLALHAQANDQVPFDVHPALEQYHSGFYQDAYISLINLAESAVYPEQKVEIAMALAAICESEYEIGNYKNANESSRAALKISPTNSIAMKYYQLLREQSKKGELKNEADIAKEETRRQMELAAEQDRKLTYFWAR